MPMGRKGRVSQGYITNTRIANYLRSNRNNAGTHTVTISGSGSKKKYNVTFTLAYKGKDTDSSVSLSFMDCAVMDAALSFYDCGKMDFTVRELLKFMYGRENITISKTIREKITGILDKLKNTEMIIDISEECRMRQFSGNDLENKHISNLMDSRELEESIKEQIRGEIIEKVRKMINEGIKSDKVEEEIKKELKERASKQIILKGTLLPWSNVGNKNELFRMDEEKAPLLYEYGEKLANQRIRYSVDLLKHIDKDDKEVKVKDTETRFLIRYYLIHTFEVWRYTDSIKSKSAHQNGNNESCHKIYLYKKRDTCAGLIPTVTELKYDGSYINYLRTPAFLRKRKKICDDIELILKYFSDIGYIGSFSVDTDIDGITPVYNVIGEIRDSFKN